MAGFSSPTAIQRQAWPVAMSGLDLVGIAETGSGKTLAYLLPALVHINAQPVAQEGDGPLALVLAPTRELAGQIHEESVRFGHPCGVRSALVVGGLPRGPQVQALRKSPEVVVATPGRLLDLLNSKRSNLAKCTYLVLDEADRTTVVSEPARTHRCSPACADCQEAEALDSHGRYARFGLRAHAPRIVATDASRPSNATLLCHLALGSADPGERRPASWRNHC